jgi:hypothetical protein
MQTGVVEANLVTLNDRFGLPQIPDLIARKTMGAEQSILPSQDLAFYQQEYERLCQALEQASDQSHLPDTRPQKRLSTSYSYRCDWHSDRSKPDERT